MCALFFDQLKGGCGSITPLNLINSLNQGFDIGNSPYQKLWTHLDYRKKRGLRLTISFTNPRGILCPGYFAGRGGKQCLREGVFKPGKVS